MFQLKEGNERKVYLLTLHDYIDCGTMEDLVIRVGVSHNNIVMNVSNEIAQKCLGRTFLYMTDWAKRESGKFGIEIKEII